MNKNKSFSFYTIAIILIILLIITFFACNNIASTAVGLTGIKIEQNQVTISWKASEKGDYSYTKLSCSNGTSEYIYEAQSCVISGLNSNTEYTFTLNFVYNTGNIYDDIAFTISTTIDSVIDLILIETSDQFNSIRYDLSAGYFLKADIDLSGYSTDGSWIPIGNTSNGFTGKFYGNGHIISNLYIKRMDDFQGLFGIINSGKINDLGLIDVDITANKNTGGLVGRNSKGSITDCYATGSVKGDNNTGGLVG